MELDYQLLDHLGNDIDFESNADPDQSFTIPARGTRVITRELTVANPELWTLERPAHVHRGHNVGDWMARQYDAGVTPFGIRTAAFDPDTGFGLNGATLKIKGVCLHEDAGDWVRPYRSRSGSAACCCCASAGINAIRCAHNPPAPEFLDLCDRLGFLVMDEAFDEWSQGKKKWVDTWSGTDFELDGYHSDFEKWADTDIEDMVLRDRNHPSIILWSIGNEIDYPNDPYPPNSEELRVIADRLIGDVKCWIAHGPSPPRAVHRHQPLVP